MGDDPESRVPVSEVGASRDDPATSLAEGIRQTGNGGVTWACPGCGADTSLAEAACSACGTPFTAWLASSAPTPPRVGPSTIAAGAVLPGAGHVMLGSVGTGAARAGLFSLWLAGGVLMLAGGGPALPVALPLLLGAAVVWAVSLIDLVGLAQQRRPLLSARGLLWLLVAVMTLAFIGGVAALGGVPGSTP